MSRDPLAVLRAELESLPMMAAMASVNGVECDSSEAEAALTQAIAQVEALVKTARNVSKQYKNVRAAEGYPTSNSKSTDELDEVLANFTPGHDSESAVAACGAVG